MPKLLPKNKSTFSMHHKKLTKKELILKRKIVSVITTQGFKINPHVRPALQTKQAYREIQQTSRLEQILIHKNFLKNFMPNVKKYSKNGVEIVPENISLELREIQDSESFEGQLFRWWNFMWWSIPYQHAYGRQMKFFLWDRYHDLPFGLIVLQSPVLAMSVRDNALGIPPAKRDYWVNMSLNAQRVGALPPYNDLLGGKMVALALTSNEIRQAYERKYKNSVTLLRKRKIKANLLFITTTSAFGKSSMYDRLKYHDELIAESLGYTKGAGTFHIPETLYQELRTYLEKKGIVTKTTFGHGPSRKLKLIEKALGYLGISNYTYHGIKREFFLFSHVKNLRDVIQKNKKPLQKILL